MPKPKPAPLPPVKVILQEGPPTPAQAAAWIALRDKLVNGDGRSDAPALGQEGQGADKGRDSSPTSAGPPHLMDILADMVQSALAWEEEHGRPPAPVGNSTSGSLKGSPTGVHWASPDGYPPLEIIAGGHDHDHLDPK